MMMGVMIDVTMDVTMGVTMGVTMDVVIDVEEYSMGTAEMEWVLYDNHKKIYTLE